MMKPIDSRVSNKLVILGLSGGVDSAVAAILLQRAGENVQALHMTNWKDDDGYCTAADDLQDARNICKKLGIVLHHAFDEIRSNFVITKNRRVAFFQTK